MDSPDKTLSELVGIFKSWVPWRPEPPSVSKDFWMPDQSCRVCYDCDSQFTVFNRRHHCRLCGRIFCAKCTANSFPVPSGDPSKAQDEWEKIRVCNYCFKQWQKGVTYFDHVTELPSLDLSSSPSGASLTSSISSGTANSTSSLTLGSRAYSVGSYQQTYCSSGPNPAQKSEMENTPVKPGEIAVKRSNIPVADGGYQSSHQYSFSMNRSDDEDEDDYGIYHSDSETKHFPHVNDYYSQLEFDDLCTDDGSQKVHLDGETIESKGTSSALLNHNCGSQGSEGTSPSRIKDDNDINVECEPPSSMYPGEDDNMEPVDFESNGLLWLPPEPEDEQDEREAGLFEDDDCYEGDSAGEWGCLRASSSFGSGDFRNKDKSTEEQKQVMKNVVDGHFRALVAQLLLVENVPLGDENDKDSWLEIVTSLSWEAATLLKPDMSTGGGMDPGGYVKVKCIASGHRSESVVIKGVVCKKNVAHRRMISKLEKPRLLILGGALEYQRVTNHLSSFDTLLQQEMDHLKMAVARIDAHHPNVLLVERSVSRFAQEYLLAKDISLVLNIKRPLLERIARCTGAQIVPSVDHLSSPKLGHCDTFHVQKFSEYLGTAGQGGKKTVKTLMYFEGCPKPLGFTILLRGANVDELKRVKHVVQYGVFAAYHLALETSFLADEGASLPELPLISPITVALPDKSSTIERSISTVPGFTLSTNEKPQGLEISGEPQRSNSIPITCLASAIHNSFNQVEGELPTDGPSSESPECTSSFINLTTILDTVPSAINFGTDSYHSYTAKKEGSGSSFVPEIPAVNSGVASTTDQFALKGCELLKKVEANPSQNDLCEVAATQQHSSEVSSQLDSNVHNNFEDSGPLKEEFPPSPSDHQSILVSLSSRCVWKGSVCERSHLFRIKYYGNFDKPLGRFLRDHLFDQNYACPSCDMPSEAHVHCYTHRQGTLTISVKKLSEILLPGEKDGKIWMWHRCLKCPRTNGFPPATRRVVMSDAAWGLSFGKFLELSFSNHAAASRVASCGHSLHRDCLRFYGFGNMVACFRYASINVLSVYLPPAKLDFNFENRDWIKKETDEVVNRAELLFSEVLNALSLSQIADKRSSVASANSGMKTETRRQIAGLELMLQKEKAEFEESLQKILNREAKKSQPAIDILEINRLRRQLLFQSYMWDHRLIYAASIHNSSIQDGLNISTAEYEGKRLSNTEKLDEVDALEKDFIHYDSRPLDPEAFIKTEQQGEFNSNTDGSDAFDEETEIDGNLDHLRQDQAKLSAAISLSDNSVTLESSNNISGTSFEDQTAIMANLSATLDAAWTGDNPRGIGVPKNDGSAHFDSTAADSSTKVVEPEHADLEGYMEDQKGLKFGYSLPTALSTKGHDNTEDYTSWLKMPFLNFYRSFNKNFITNTAKLDTLGDYNPVFVSSFRELEFEGSARLLLPVGTNDTVIPVYDDEPTSIIAYALMSPEYHGQLNDDLEKMKDSGDFSASMNLLDSVSSHSFHSVDELTIDSYKSFGPSDDSFLSVTGSRSSLILDPLSYTKAMHVKVSFGDVGPTSKVKYSVTCYYAQRFDALRRICCPSELDFTRSLSRCKKWGAQGGKSNVFFAKTLDDRFIIKQVTKTELESFIKFGPGYFKYLSESISSRCPTCLAKILGIYQVTSKHLKGGRETKIDVLVMENLLFGRNVTRLYDLKGSSRSRYNPDSSGSNKVLLDQNLIEAMPTSPIFVGNKAKRLLERAVWNDTSFLASIDVMDYSLLVGVDEENHELVLGIIDFMRQYTWDKHLETWVKASRILGGNTNLSPTVISPKQYKKRFRKAMTTYFLMVPDQWSPPCTVTSKSQAEVGEENIPGGTSVQ